MQSVNISCSYFYRCIFTHGTWHKATSFIDRSIRTLQKPIALVFKVSNQVFLPVTSLIIKIICIDIPHKEVSK